MPNPMLLRILVVLAALQPAVVRAADWVVTKVSQPSQFTVDKVNWRPVREGIAIPNQSWIATGPRGRVVLERAKDRVTFQPGTVAGVFEKKGFSIETEFAQQTGSLALNIDPQVKPHLAVQTPYLAAVVKGTIFTVSVTAKGAKVGVERGRVEVTDPRSGERVGVHAGQSVSVDTDPDTSMSLSGPNKDVEPIVHVTPTEPKVPAKDDGSQTNAGAAEANAIGADAATQNANGLSKKHKDNSSDGSHNGANSGSGDSGGAGGSKGQGGSGGNSGRGGEHSGGHGNSGGKGGHESDGGD